MRTAPLAPPSSCQEQRTKEVRAFYFTNGEQDRLISIENVIGTDTSDMMRGNGSGNEFLGNGSADELFGEGGKDTLRGGAGNDSLSGGAESNFVFSDDNDDKLEGGADADTLDGGDGIDTARCLWRFDQRWYRVAG